MITPRWLFLSALSALGYGVATVASYQLINTHGVPPVSVLAVTDVIAAALFLLLPLFVLPGNLGKGMKNGLRTAFTRALPAAITVALLFGFGDLFLNASYAGSPNPGYCDSISDSEMVVTAILSYLVFKSPITAKQLIGMLIAVFSLYFLQS
jgi:drug/metabolite transporter (DMT)-like permease